MTGKLIVHVGAPKCGSSALQRALSIDADVLARQGVVYAALHKDAGILHRKALANAAASSAHGYIRSMSPSQFGQLGQRRQNELRHDLRRLVRKNKTVIVSNEGMLLDASPAFGQMFSGLGVHIELVAYLRPQTPWLNSAWWQWGAWGNLDIDGFVAARLPKVQWAQHACRLRGMPWVEQVHLRVLPKDIVSDLHSFLGLETECTGTHDRSNVSLPADVLRLYQRNRQLRRDPHDSQLDFVLERRLKFSGSAPWVIGPGLIETILSGTQSDTRKLQGLLPPDQAKLVQEDPRWRHVSAFADRSVEQASSMPADPQALDALCVRLLETIEEMDDALRRSEAGPGTIQNRFRILNWLGRSRMLRAVINR